MERRKYLRLLMMVSAACLAFALAVYDVYAYMEQWAEAAHTSAMGECERGATQEYADGYVDGRLVCINENAQQTEADHDLNLGLIAYLARTEQLGADPRNGVPGVMVDANTIHVLALESDRDPSTLGPVEDWRCDPEVYHLSVLWGPDGRPLVGAAYVDPCDGQPEIEDGSATAGD